MTHRGGATHSGRQGADIGAVKLAVCQAFDLTAFQLASRARKARKFSIPRQIGIWLAYRAGNSTRRIAREFARDRATVRHATRRVDQLRQTQPDMARLTDDLLARVAT